MRGNDKHRGERERERGANVVKKDITQTARNRKRHYPRQIERKSVKNKRNRTNDKNERGFRRKIFGFVFYIRKFPHLNVLTPARITGFKFH